MTVSAPEGALTYQGRESLSLIRFAGTSLGCANPQLQVRECYGRKVTLRKYASRKRGMANEQHCF